MKKEFVVVYFKIDFSIVLIFSWKIFKKSYDEKFNFEFFVGAFFVFFLQAANQL